MGLKDRLDTLKRQSGRAAERPSAPPVSERVRRLRAGGEPRAEPRAARQPVEAVAAAIGGEVLADGLIGVQAMLPLSTRHGRVALEAVVGAGAALPEASELVLEDAVFFDTETTGLSGGTGTAVFLLGMGRVEGSALRVQQYLITSFTGERALYEAAGDWLGDAAALVSFNGKSFDQPLLSARARLVGVADPFARRAHLDLLHPTRRAFGRRWSDCRLATAERELIGFFRVDDLPGAEAPEAWFAYLHRGDASRLPGVARHNHWDVVSLAALLPALAAAHDDPAAAGADALAIARGRLRHGDEPSAYRLLSGAQSDLDEAGLLELARLHRGRLQWAAACAIWERLAEEGCGEALERLAKYHEHECRDFGRALAYAWRLPPSAERDRRCRRLEERIARGGGLFGSVDPTG